MGSFQISGKKKWKNLKITRNGWSCLLQPYIESATILSPATINSTLYITQKLFTSKWKKRDVGLADTMVKKSTEQERVEYSNAHLQSLHCVAY